MTVVDSPEQSSRRGRTRERLLDAAYDVFAETGVHTASVEQVSERAGFTRGAFYSNFSSKEELFFALMERENGLRLAGLVEQMGRTIPKLGGEPLTGEALGAVVLDFLHGPFDDDRRWCLVQSEFELLALRDPAIAPRYSGFRARFDASLVEIIGSALQEVGRTFALEPTSAVRLVLATYEDAVKQSILDGDSDGEALERLRSSLTGVVIAVSTPV
ncbi:TetR/AcrR family transcriptional regulator [Rathayibacter sp. ZW T2_19]|uniref:TetR/AcrR family transcriptional regulator n=1 Tax=Rathayibacter rubneri TaxID=2950106 RepID=A0A9X2DWM1_9MICO|nr:TetR/AcrR family transcriptional regulator [Rathayibacter rubneri]MCM6762425.1 TetR/AcrR family transcriptional regulator [Rathayibacter rubneri]